MRLPLAALALSTALSAPALAVTLEEAVTLAVGAHPTVKAAEAAARAAGERIDDTRGELFPTLDFEGDTGYEYANNSTTRGRGRADGTEGGVTTWRKAGEMTLTQKLFDGFDTWNRLTAAQKEAAAARSEISDARQTIGLRAVEAYLTVVRNRLVQDLAKENVAKHRDVLDDVRIRADSGAGSQGDVNQAESRLALAEARLIEIEGNLRESEAQYNEAVGAMPDDLGVPAPIADFPAEVETALKTAIANNPSLRAAHATVDARVAETDAADAPLMPEIDLELSEAREWNTGGTRENSVDRKAVVVMRYNFFRGGSDLAKRRRAAELETEARQNEYETRRRIERQIRIDYAAFQTANTRLEALTARAVASAEAVIAYRKQFEIGRRTLLDALDVENELFQAKVALVDGDLQEKLSQYRVLTTMGELLSSLGVVASSGDAS